MQWWLLTASEYSEEGLTELRMMGRCHLALQKTCSSQYLEIHALAIPYPEIYEGVFFCFVLF